MGVNLGGADGWDGRYRQRVVHTSFGGKVEFRPSSTHGALLLEEKVKVLLYHLEPLHLLPVQQLARSRHHWHHLHDIKDGGIDDERRLKLEALQGRGGVEVADVALPARPAARDTVVASQTARKTLSLRKGGSSRSELLPSVALWHR